MDRRHFIYTSAMGLAGLGMMDVFSAFEASAAKKDGNYSIVILGDTHFDTEPASVYHSNYNEKVEWLNRVQRAEFARNGEMWRERCPRLLKRASRLIDDNTKMVFQMGDLIQGDCGNGEVHKKMLGDVMDCFKKELGGLPFVTVVGNHDIRGVDAEAAYHTYMPMRMSQELGKSIMKTTFGFNIGDDAYIFLDFNTPDDAEIESLLNEYKKARHLFIVTHGPVIPNDGANCRWIFHGGESEENTKARLHFRKEFAKRNAIVLCGHIHTTDLSDWYGDGGAITQMTMNSVWSKDELGKYTIAYEGAEHYGDKHKAAKTLDSGAPVKDQSALLDEYRPGLKRYVNSPAAGSYKLNVSRKSITVDFYAGDSEDVSETFILR